MTRTRTLVAALALAATGAAFAQEGTVDFPQPAWRPMGALAAQPAGTTQTANEAQLTQQPASTLTRAQVIAEMREARRLGLMDFTELGTERSPTLAQLEQIRQAGLRAVDSTLAGTPSNQRAE